MPSILGYITETERLRLYTPQMVADCLAIPVSRVYSHHGCCFGGGMAQTLRKDGIACVFSGTLLNRQELARDFHTPDEPPAICAEMYHRLGGDFAARLDGPFVAVVYDRHARVLRLYRDHTGQERLFYAALPNGTTLFSDDLDTLRRMPCCPSAIDLKSLADFLALGYVPSPETIYHGIRKLASGSCLTLRQAHGLPAIHRYWRPQFEPKLDITLDDAAATVQDLIGGAMARALAAAPSCGVLLSGGIDSNLVAAYSTGAETFTAGFDDERYDERALAARAAAWLKLKNTQIEVVPADWQMLGRLQALNGEPFGDSSIIPTTMAMTLAWRHSVGHVLTGSGGDEVFGGYRRYQAMAIRRLLGLCLPFGASHLLGRLVLKALPAHRDGRSRLATIRRMASFLRMEPLAGFASFQEIASDDLKNELLRDARVREQPSYLLEFAEQLENGTAQNFPEAFNELDFLTYLPDDGCAKERLAARAAGVTRLSPLLDRDVVEFGVRLPAAMRLTLFQRKRALRAAGRGRLLPELFVQGKRGFGMPVSSWFRDAHAGTARALSEELNSWDEQGWFNADAVSRLVNEHLQGTADHGAQLWMLLCLKEWLQGRKRL